MWVMKGLLPRDILVEIATRVKKIYEKTQLEGEARTK